LKQTLQCVENKQVIPELPEFENLQKSTHLIINELRSFLFANHFPLSITRICSPVMSNAFIRIATNCHHFGFGAQAIPVMQYTLNGTHRKQVIQDKTDFEL
jgi:hypothetical protein